MGKQKTSSARLRAVTDFDTTDLNSIGEAFFDVFDMGELTCNDIVENCGAIWPPDVDTEESLKRIDLNDWFERLEMGEKLVRELEDRGFRIAKE